MERERKITQSSGVTGEIYEPTQNELFQARLKMNPQNKPDRYEERLEEAQWDPRVLASKAEMVMRPEVNYFIEK